MNAVLLQSHRKGLTGFGKDTPRAVPIDSRTPAVRVTQITEMITSERH